MNTPVMLTWNIDEIALGGACKKRNRNFYNNSSRFMKTLLKRNLKLHHQLLKV